MDILRQRLGTSAPVSAATVAQKVQDSHEGIGARMGLVQVLLLIVLFVLLMLSWGVWRLERHAQHELQLLQRLTQ